MKKSKAILLVASVLIGAALLLVPSGPSKKIKNLSSGFFLPFFNAKRSVEKSINETTIRTQSPKELRQKIKKLEGQLAIERIKVQEFDELKRSLNEISSLINIPEYSDWDLIAGRVIFRDPVSWWRTVNIDLGSKDEISPGMPVITGSGLIGKILEVQNGFSKVQLIGDEKCRIGAMLISGDAGIIQINHSSRANPLIVDMDYLPSYSSPKQGDWVISSGLGERIPKGIKIGQVIDSESVGNGQYKQAKIKLAVRLGSVENVWVIRAQ